MLDVCNSQEFAPVAAESKSAPRLADQGANTWPVSQSFIASLRAADQQHRRGWKPATASCRYQPAIPPTGPNQVVLDITHLPKHRARLVLLQFHR